MSALFFLNPQISSVQKQQLLHKAVPDELLFRFLSIVLERGKFSHLSEITRRYHQMVAALSQTIEATLITAVAIDEQLHSQLKERLEGRYHKPVTLSAKIDPQLLGGALVILDNKILDFSVRGRLEKMKRMLQRRYGTET